MKKFTDIFIQRPVLAIVVSLLIFIIGLRSLQQLPVREFPEIKNTVITVTTVYPGASADLIKGFITAPLEKSIAGADGIDYISSTSTDDVSTISLFVKLNFNPDTAFTSVMSKVAQVANDLPTESQQPVIQKTTGSSVALMYIGFYSDLMNGQQITDYVSRVVQPKLETVSGVASADILGARIFAMRIWLDPKRMAALEVTPTDVVNALRANNFQASAGNVKGKETQISLDVRTDVQDVQGFKRLIIKKSGSTVVRLNQVATVELGAESYDSSVIFNGGKAVFVAINATPDANPLTVIQSVRTQLPGLEQSYPSVLKSKVVYDATKYISASIREVVQTIAEATVIVILVIFLFMGSIRTVVIPIVTIPLSLIGVGLLMLALKYSINLFTLLAMVLSIGLVVDDAIVMVENVYRHIEEGKTPFDAALQGAREIAVPIISMTITLAAVYAPIGFMTGLTGALFTEFALTLACTVIISGLVALTLSPMMCSKLLKPHDSTGHFVQIVDRVFFSLKNHYQRRLHASLNYRPVTLVFAGLILFFCYAFYVFSQHELAPQEDKGFLISIAIPPEYANIHYIEKYTQELNQIYSSLPEVRDYFYFNNLGTSFSGAILKPWNERKASDQELRVKVQAMMNKVAGLQMMSIPLSPLPQIVQGAPFQFVLTSTDSYEKLFAVAGLLEAAARESGMFMYLNSSLLFDKPQLVLHVNRERAAILGINMADIAATLNYSLGGNFINRFSMEGLSYKVIPQLGDEFRLNADDLKKIYMKTSTNTLVPLSSILTASYQSQPNSLTRFQQLNSVTLQGAVLPGRTMDQALTYLQAKAKEILPSSVSYDYAGQLRSAVQEGGALAYTFFFALLVIFLVLAAQFESFRDPLIVMISVPMSIFGALLPLFMGFATVNIYTQIGLVTLIGLISKHGILMVEFANKLQQLEGLSIREAIEKAASIRLRPILMTTAATVTGVLPLILSNGPGANSRYNLGLVIAVGMSIGTLFTLFVVPTMYTFLAKKHLNLTQSLASPEY